MSRTTLLIITAILVFSMSTSAQEPQAFPTKPNPDLNEDYEVNSLDIFFFSLAWNWMSEQYSHTPLSENSSSYGERSDFNEDGIVDKEDGYIFTSAWKQARQITETPMSTVTPIPTPEPPTPTPTSTITPTLTPTPTITPTSTPKSGWVQVFPPLAPSARSGHAMAYDAVRKRVVLFGGTEGWGHAFGDTWEWDGKEWTQANPSLSPSAREGHTMTYDVARNKTILFGGRSHDGNYNYKCNDTWEWDGQEWNMIANTGSEPCVGPRMAYDISRKKIVLFGGLPSARLPLGNTWEWDEQEWKLIDMSLNPEPRYSHAMVYDAERKKVVLFGGSLEERELPEHMLGDTWEWDGETWKLVANTGPEPRIEHSMIYSYVRKKIVLFGGEQKRYEGYNWQAIISSDTWEWDGKTWTLIINTGPQTREGHAMAYDINRGRIVLFGGWGYRVDGSYGELSDTWEYIP